tara:strand:+ start:99 stop:275 length:177 start_codon:yes stop_codon:yes gene_type:complete
MTYVSKPLITLRQKNNCPVVHVWKNGSEVINIELTPRETMNLIKGLAERLEINGTYRT